MATNRTELNIPVRRDARTFEQRRKDMLTNLERRTSTRLSDRSGAVHTVSSTSDTAASSLTPDSTLSGSHFRSRDDWDEEVDRWIGESRRRFNEEMRRMRQDMFALEPMDEFELDSWNKMGSIRPFETGGEHSSMLDRMERKMESLRQQMDSLSTIGSSPRLAGPVGSNVQSSSSRITTTSTTSTSSSGDPRGVKTQSNVKESVQHSRTVNGVTTGTSSQSTVSSSATGPEALRLTENVTPGSLLPQSSVSGGVMDFLKDAYELDEDGQVHFKVRFNAKDFAPEDIDVTTVENRLTVHAKKTFKSGSTESSKEFCRTIDLPRSIDHEHFQCHLTEDGVLILDAPVKAPDYQSITFDKDHQLSIRPKSEFTTGSTRSAALVPLGVAGPTIMKDGITGRKLHMEVPVDSIYTAEDLCVRMDANQITVSGKHGGSGGVPRNEFTRSYEIPETVDPFSVVAQLCGTTLIIEAPLLCTV
ncbi:hypothetical protein EG68_02969 [Paragonimus skrjabini miyazakii]|uniref:SHSP domain-containing protein n=1 Tax=Paragonimus skrjabini miyazakii TaxID=59628 RepID=A0A8S9Z9B1_9TREM|nr:hypothetical protein EG68_02969 [Paragonimus skrjabini miyazakii]